jgi:hypothetical protein
MDIVWSLALLFGFFLAFNFMSGGRASNVLRPAIRLVENSLSFVIKAVFSFFSAVLRLGGGSVKVPKVKNGKDNGPSGPQPPRWN